jgi:hypothetical protein
MTPPAAFTFADGVLGQEGIHNWRGLIDINTQTGLPRIEVDRFTGLHALPEADDDRAPAVGRIGEIVYPSQPRGKTITYEGRILGRTLHDLRSTSASLRTACADRSTEGVMTVRPHPTIGGVQTYYSARVLALELDDDQSPYSPDALPTPYQRGFVLTLRMSDPRHYLVGAAHYAAVSASSVGVTNQGNAPTEPVFIVNGPISDDLVFERLDNPDYRKLLFDSVTLASGQQLRLDFKNRTLRRVSDGTDYMGKLVIATSNWWDESIPGLMPGNTGVRAALGAGTAGTNAWSIDFAHANW